ncbi:MAG: SIS domain-containing protein [Chloroflexota bacterium]|nr:SIS domain-containing protein [Chloroflexota bacterium]
MIIVEDTQLYTEIHEQPQVLSCLIERERDVIQQLAHKIQEHEITHVVIAARGTSDNAARYAKYLLGSTNRLPVALATPSLYTVYKKPPKFQNTLVLGISQSGKSPDIVAVLAEAQEQGALTATFTNIPESDLGRVADYVIDIEAGEERSIAATKTYTSELTAIALLSACLADDQSMLAEIESIPAVVGKTLSMDAEIRRIAARYRYMVACVTIGRGYNYATAFELALKLKELTYTVVEPYSSADFLHGPLAMVEPGFPVIVIAPTGMLIPEIRGLIHTLNDWQAEVIAISDDPETLGLACIPLSLPRSVPEWLSPITCIVPGQLFAMHLAAERNYNPDHPRGLSKVTETV